ncbi:MAG TPA: VOC family protein [Bryobacterales bacterium]|jgi:catechol 2,3-dioxygenase-like lactoylglutathione lyase family enzyme|nr:VOC family protein [Bryobacterales bacterium]
MFKVEQIDHIALTVADVERSVAWYRDVLGLERRYQEAWGSFPAVMCAGSTAIALFPAASTEPGHLPRAKRPTVIRHLAFRTNRANFEEAQVDLKSEISHSTLKTTIFVTQSISGTRTAMR